MAISMVSMSRLADHHHIRMLAQDGAQTAGKGHIDSLVDLRLVNAVQIIFDRILGPS